MTRFEERRDLNYGRKKKRCIGFQSNVGKCEREKREGEGGESERGKWKKKENTVKWSNE